MARISTDRAIRIWIRIAKTTPATPAAKSPPAALPLIPQEIGQRQHIGISRSASRRARGRSSISSARPRDKRHARGTRARGNIRDTAIVWRASFRLPAAASRGWCGAVRGTFRERTAPAWFYNSSRRRRCRESRALARRLGPRERRWRWNWCAHE